MDNDMTKEYTRTKEKYVYQSYTEYNPLTGLYFTKAFYKKVEEFIRQAGPEPYCMVAIDIEHFMLFNKIFGREQGDCLLVRIADKVRDFQKCYGGVVGYIGGDNFGVLMPYKTELIPLLYAQVKSVIEEWSNTVGFQPALGVYPINDNKISAATMYDRAMLAMSSILGNYLNRCCEYSTDMEEKAEKEVELLAEIQRGLEKEEFTFFVQPQCDISTGKIVGGEALIRWQHATKGMISPGVFIPILEKNGFIATVDQYVWTKVCQWMRGLIDRGFTPVPISINVSRVDIFTMDVPGFLNDLIQTYELPTRLLKVEVTESAYAENNDKIVNAVKELRNFDFLVMMDDFGSGYSSLNMLKEVAVDVLKMDMRFLDIKEKEETKGVGILESVVNMAKQMQMPIIAEGVETQKQEDMLLKMGCRYSQGYLYYKPMPFEDFEQLIGDEQNLDLNGLQYKQKESLHIREIIDSNFFSDTMLNNILGPIAFYDMYENKIEITRGNEHFYHLAGVSASEGKEIGTRLWEHVRDDDKQLMVSIFKQAYLDMNGYADGFVHCVREDGEILWVYIKIFFLREREGHKIFYGSLTDMTMLLDCKKEEGFFEADIEELTDKQIKHLGKSYDNLPCAYGVAKLSVDEKGKPVNYEVVYANSELCRVGGGNIERLKYLMKKLFANQKEELLENTYKVGILGEDGKYQIYSPISCRYLQFKLYQYQHGYVSFMMQDVTHNEVYKRTMKSVMIPYREVYFIHLQDNYCRMVYPDHKRLIEKENYEEAINRHFKNGRIMPHNEENVRKFLSLENLKDELANQDTVEYKYLRSNQQGEAEWCVTAVNVCERNNGSTTTAIMTIRSAEA